MSSRIRRLQILSAVLALLTLAAVRLTDVISGKQSSKCAIRSVQG